jgi:hypothetical protein
MRVAGSSAGRNFALDQNKEIQQPDPGNAGGKMDPAQQNLDMRRGSFRKDNLR